MATVHIVPIGDLIQHDAPEGDPPSDPGHRWLSVEELPGDDLADCPCGATTKPVKFHTGEMGWMVVHHSLDGRELTEDANAHQDG